MSVPLRCDRRLRFSSYCRRPLVKPSRRNVGRNAPTDNHRDRSNRKCLAARFSAAIARGMKPDGDLDAELAKLDDYSIRSRKDAKAICGAPCTLASQPSDGEKTSSRLHALTALFQDVDGRDAPAFDVLYHDGLPQLIRVFDAKIKQANDEDVGDLLFMLKIFAMYGSRDGAERIVRERGGRSIRIVTCGT